MTQQPSPYSQPPIGYQPYAPTTGDPMAPARYASILMIVLGILMLLLGGCMGIVGAMLPTILDKMPPEQVRVMQDLEANTHLSATALFVGLAIFLGVIALMYIVVGVFVRRGGLGSVITGIVLTVLTVLYLLLNAIGSLAQGPGGTLGVCFSLLLLGLFGWLLVLLIQATRSASRMRNLQAQYQTQYMQYQQMMQQYGQPPGYGYGYPAPPPPQAPMPPSSMPPGPDQGNPNGPTPQG
jgi:hypothetical protein